MLVTVCAIMAAPVFADFITNGWRYYKPINLPDNIQDGSLIQLEPDNEVFGGSALNLIDLRIIENDIVEIPYGLEISKTASRSISFPANLQDQAYIPGEFTTFVADVGPGNILHNEMEIRTPASNFLLTLFVEASKDNVTWVNLSENTIYDFTSDDNKFSTRNTRIKYSDSTARFLRVKIMTPILSREETPLKVSDVSIFFVKKTVANEKLWDTATPSIIVNKELKTTVIDIDLGTEGLPNHKLELIVPNINFYRETKLETSSNLDNWNILTMDSIYVYDTPEFTGHNLVLQYPETTSRYLRVSILNQDNQPLNVQTVNVFGFQRKLIFTVDSNKSYKIYYGNKQANEPSYDIEQILPYMDSLNIPKANLGPHTKNIEFVTTEPISERIPWLLSLVVVSATIIVGIFLFGIIRQAKKILPPPQQ